MSAKIIIGIIIGLAIVAALAILIAWLYINGAYYTEEKIKEAVNTARTERGLDDGTITFVKIEKSDWKQWMLTRKYNITLLFTGGQFDGQTETFVYTFKVEKNAEGAYGLVVSDITAYTE